MSAGNTSDPSALEERALKFACGFKYIGGEVQLAMQSAGMRCYIEGYRDHEREQEAGIPCTKCGKRLLDVREIEINGDVAAHKDCPATALAGYDSMWKALIAECDAIDEMIKMGPGCVPEAHNILRWLRNLLAKYEGGGKVHDE